MSNDKNDTRSGSGNQAIRLQKSQSHTSLHHPPAVHHASDPGQSNRFKYGTEARIFAYSHTYNRMDVHTPGRLQPTQEDPTKRIERVEGSSTICLEGPRKGLSRVKPCDETGPDALESVCTTPAQGRETAFPKPERRMEDQTATARWT